VYLRRGICAVGVLSLNDLLNDFLLDYFFLAGHFLCDLLYTVKGVRFLFLVTEDIE